MPKINVPDAALDEVQAIIKATEEREAKIARVAEIDATIEPLQAERASLMRELAGNGSAAPSPRRRQRSRAGAISEGSIVDAVKSGMTTNKALAEHFGVSTPTITKHVNELIESKALRTEGVQRGRKLVVPS